MFGQRIGALNLAGGHADMRLNDFSPAIRVTGAMDVNPRVIPVRNLNMTRVTASAMFVKVANMHPMWERRRGLLYMRNVIEVLFEVLGRPRVILVPQGMPDAKGVVVELVSRLRSEVAGDKRVAGMPRLDIADLTSAVGLLAALGGLAELEGFSGITNGVRHDRPLGED